jgi:hypothetical protein
MEWRATTNVSRGRRAFATASGMSDVAGLPIRRGHMELRMKTIAVALCALLAASSIAASDAGAAPVRQARGHAHHRPAHPVHRPAHPVHRPAHPVHRPAHPVHRPAQPIHRPVQRPVAAPPIARRTVVIGAGHRPVHPWWRPGGAIAAGAAIGFVAGATAAAWAGPPPGPTYCWFYTDETRTNGFWDICPP